ncbi:MAG: pitrilysin family protein [Planctomycetota bacterium]
MKRQAAALVTLLLLLAPTALSGAQKITTVEGITEYALDNGLRVLLFPDESKPTVTLNITYIVGSRHEGYGETGMAHLLEHLMFKGTPSHRQIWKELQDHGAQFNGTTWVDRTNYFETLKATPENLEYALELEADRMVNSFIAQSDLDSEMAVVRNEFEIGENNPLAILSERIRSTAYLWHNYGKSTIGSREDIERVPITRLQAFYKKYYQPDNAVLVVAGKFDEAKTLALIEKLYGKIPRSERALEPTYTMEPAQDGEREVALRRAGDVQAIGCVYHICAGAHEDCAPLQVLAHVLSAEQTGRLYRALVEPQLATSVSASAEALCEPGLLEINVEARTDKPMDEIRARLLSTLDGLATGSFSEEEVERAKKNFARGFALLLNDSQRVAIRLTESAASGDWRLMFLHRDRMAKVTPADVQRVTALYLKPSNRTVGVFIPGDAPDRSPIPPAPDVRALVKDYRGAQAVAKGTAFEPTYANIDAHTLRSQLSVGAKLALLPKETRGNSVTAALTFHYGSAAALKGRTDAASLVGPMLMRGTAKHTRREIEDRLAELKSRFRIGAGGTGFLMGGGGASGVLQASIESTRENLAGVLELMGEILREPAFPADEFEKLKKETLAQLEQQKSEPMMIAMVEMQRRLNPYPPDDVRYVPSIDEQIARLEAVTLDQVQGVYQELIGASAAQVAFVGDFDAAQVSESLEKCLAGWRSKVPYERIASPYRTVKPESIAIPTPDKTSAMFTMGLPIEMRDDDPEYPALFTANFILGSSMNSRLMNRIRQKEGLSYGCGSFISASPHERSGTFMAFGMCAPENAQRGVQCALEEIALLDKAGVTQEELDDARKGYRQQMEVMLAMDAMLAMQLASNLYLDRTMKFAQGLMDRIGALKPGDVQGAAAKYLQPGQVVTVLAGDFKEKTDSARQ